MTPAARLRAAADLIEQTAAAATPGPWLIDVHGTSRVYADQGDYDREVFIDPEARTQDAAWVALLGPDTAPALAAWLRSAATDGEPSVWRALAFADLILRGQA